MIEKIGFQSDIPEKDRMSISVIEFEKGQKNDKQYYELLKHSVKLIRDYCPEPASILEFGAGTGLFSEVYVPEFKNSHIVITEPDKILINEIPKKLANYPKVEYVQARAQSFDSNVKFDVITGTEAYHHVPDDEKLALFQNFKKLISTSGVVVIGDNFIPEYDINNPDSRIEALHKFWDPYIKTKRDAGDEDGVKTFTYALKQAESGLMEYKTSLEVFEKYASDADFEIVKKDQLSGDIDNKGGYCVYVLKLKKV